MKNLDEVDLQAALLDFIMEMPDMDVGALEQGKRNEYLKRYFEICERAIAKGPSSYGHYVKGVLHSLRGQAPFYDAEKAKEELLRSAYLGNISGAIDYITQVDFKTTESLALCQAILDSGRFIHSLKEDFDFYMSQLSGQERQAVISMAQSIRDQLAARGLEFHEC